jgi:hypothetical protein
MQTERIVERYEGNPILTKDRIPYPVHTVHNAGMTKHESRYLMLFRAHEATGRSLLGIAESGDGGDFGDTGPSLLSFFLLEGPWWAETLTQSHPFQPMPVYNGVHKLWVPRGDGHRVLDVTDVVTEAIQRKMTTMELALSGPDTDMNTGKYFHPEGAQLVLTH